MRKRFNSLLILLVVASLVFAGCGERDEAIGLDEQEKIEEGAAEEAAGAQASESAEEEEAAEGQASEEQEPETHEANLCFAGDINFDENWATTQYMDTCENGIYDCIDSRLIEVMTSADIMWINNEFTYSTRGTPTEGKAYTFRANPSRVENLAKLGVDIVGLANNHIYDYGQDAFEDTLATLTEAGIPYVGAGYNLAEAMSPVYMEVDGITIAYVAASRAEKIKLTPQATEDTPGILRCYDTTLFDQEIAQAKENADFVVALVHWGTEYSTDLEDVQRETAREYIDAGADAIVGAHTHCLQGFEYYEGKPIVYSLGNYWFNEKTLDSMLISLQLTQTDDETTATVQITPALQQNYTTTYVEDTDSQRALYDRLEDISINVTIDDDGYVMQNQ